MYQFRLFFAQYDILSYVPARSCTVSFTGHDGIRHSVNVQAETLYEAVVLAIRAFRENDCAPGPASQLEVEARCVWQEYLAHFGGLIWPTPKLLILR